MCGRYYIPEDDAAEELREIIDEIQRRDSNVHLKRGEIFPSDVVPVLANNRSMVVKPFAMTWGYKFPDGKPIINARYETASAKPMFKDGMLQRRCLIPAAWYFEWEKRDGKRIKYAIGPKDTKILYMAVFFTKNVHQKNTQNDNIVLASDVDKTTYRRRGLSFKRSEVSRMTQRIRRNHRALLSFSGFEGVVPQQTFCKFGQIALFVADVFAFCRLRLFQRKNSQISGRIVFRQHRQI